MSDQPIKDNRLERAVSSSTSGGPMFVRYAVRSVEGGMVVVTLPHNTTRSALARRLRAMADEIEPTP